MLDPHKSQVSVGSARRVIFTGEEVPHPGLERRDPAGADAGDGADLDQRGRDRLSQTSQPCPAHSTLFPWTGRFIHMYS